MIKNPYKTEDDKILYNGSYMEAFIPDEFFQKGLAENVDTGFKIFGNFITYHYGSRGQDRSTASIASFELPMMFMTYPDEVTNEVLDIGYGEQKYRVFEYTNGTVMVANNKIIQEVGNVEKMSGMMMEGKLDNMSYERIPVMYLQCKQYNNTHLRVPAMYEEVIISKTYFNPDNVNQAARFIAKEGVPTKVKGLTLREKAAFTSTFAATTFEDKISMLTVSDNAKREGRKEVISSIEKVSLGIRD